MIKTALLAPAAIGALAAAALVTGLAAAGGLLVVGLGLYDVRASAPHSRLVSWAIHETMIHATERHARLVRPPSGFTQAEIVDGLQLYNGRCLACHGAPGVSRQPWTKGLTPSPPYLLDAGRRWNSAELYVIVADGVKMTAMPAWGTTLSNRQVWDLVGFLRALPDMTSQTYSEMSSGPPPTP